MTKRTTLCLSAALALGLLAGATVSHSQTSNSSAPPEVRKAILARLAEIQTAAESLDADKVFSYVLENNEGALAQNGKLFLTRKDALESTKQGFQALRSIGYQMDEQGITMLSPTVALLTGEGSSTVTTADGRTFTNRFAQSVVFVFADGEWKVLHSHRSFPRAN